MKVILYKDYPSLGEEGDVKVVADGYARNYLLPRKIAVQYTKATQIELEQKQQAIIRRKKSKVDAASDLKSRIEGMEMDYAVAAGENGRLFGSVTSTAVVDFLRSRGLEVERKRVEMPEGGIKTTGTHRVTIKLYGGSEADLKINVTASKEAVHDDAPPKRTVRAAKAPAADVTTPAADTGAGRLADEAEAVGESGDDAGDQDSDWIDSDEEES
jgi:large subunit ribosomal protein L9